MRKALTVFILIQWLIANLFGLWLNLYPKINEVIEEREVTIVDRYTILTGDSSESTYLTGTDGEQYYKIVGDGYEAGDVVRIYRNANSTNAKAAELDSGDPEWFLSLKMLRREESFRAVFFSVIVIVNAAVLAVYIKKIRDGRKKETV